MLKEFMEFLFEMKRPETVEVQGRTYATKGLTRVDAERDVDTIVIQSLSGIVDYIQSNFDHERPVMIQVASPTEVNVYDALNNDNNRRSYIQAKALLPDITFERFMSREQFNIMVQACFVGSVTKEKVLKVISSIVEDNSITQNDDGVSQRATVNSGIATRITENIPNPVGLKPFRTFAEVTQPESDFILRLREGGNVGLFEADGGAWELNAMQYIKGYFESQLADLIKEKKVVIVA